MKTKEARRYAVLMKTRKKSSDYCKNSCGCVFVMYVFITTNAHSCCTGVGNKLTFTNRHFKKPPTNIAAYNYLH